MQLSLLLRMVWKHRQLRRQSRWTVEQLRSYQSARLAELRRFAVQNSPFYRRFHRGLEGCPLEDLPILTKSMMMDNFDDFVTDRDLRLKDVKEFLAGDPGLSLFRGKYVVLLSSGTTGGQGFFLFDPGEWTATLANLTRPMGLGPPRERLGKPWRAATIGSVTPWYLSARGGASLSVGWVLQLEAFEPVGLLVRRLNEWQPRVLGSYPSVLGLLAEEQLGGRLQLNLKRIYSGSEVLTEGTRRRIREAWGLDPYETYATTEYGPIALDCALGKKHLLEDGAVIEIVDEHGRAVPPGGTGDRVLLSVFDRRTQPLIRYEISDKVRLTNGACECGRQFRLIDAVDGRKVDIFTFPHKDGGGARVTTHAAMYYGVMENVPAAAWQMVHDERGLWASFVGPRGPHVLEGVEAALREVLERHGALVPPIYVREVSVLERGATGKAPLTLSRMPK